jgi:hypothetical protein
MVVYGLALGNQRQLSGGDFSTRTDELWPGTAGSLIVRAENMMHLKVNDT